MSVFLVWKLDFDVMENHNPECRKILGYCASQAEADAFVAIQPPPTYEGYSKEWALKNGKWEGEYPRYPRYAVEEVKGIGKSREPRGTTHDGSSRTRACSSCDGTPTCPDRCHRPNRRKPR